jgi:ATP-dependent Lon protease
VTTRVFSAKLLETAKDMSDAMKKVEGIRHLPIFPLPLVLLPNEFLPLHIFEPRYRKMLDDVRKEQNFFGVTFYDLSNALDERPEPGTVGCVAEVREVNEMPDGRSNILTFGVVRYRLIDYVDVGEPYLVGDLEFFEDDEEDKSVLVQLGDEVHALFERIAKAAFKLSGNQGTLPDIPKTDPQQMSFLITAAFHLENELKYEMAEITSTTERLEKLRKVLLRAVGKLEANADIQQIAKTNGHSNKKIDLD